MEILNYKKIGTGNNTILFLHELMGDCRNYEPIIPFLNTTDFIYIFIDLRGYGLSKDISGEYTCQEASSDVIKLINHLNISNFTLVAHSMSTMIAQKITLLESKVKRLILITPISAAGIKTNEKYKNMMLNDMREKKNKIEKIVYSASKRYNQTWCDYRIDMGYSSSTIDARVGYMKMYLETDFLDEAKNIEIPIKIITGIHDFNVFSKESIEVVFKDYKDVEIFECSEAGHYPMIECPAYFATKVEKLATN